MSPRLWLAGGVSLLLHAGALGLLPGLLAPSPAAPAAREISLLLYAVDERAADMQPLPEGDEPTPPEPLETTQPERERIVPTVLPEPVAMPVIATVTPAAALPAVDRPAVPITTAVLPEHYAAPATLPAATPPQTVATAPAARLAPDRVISVTELRYRRAPAPAYPPLARQRGYQGLVRVRVVVDETGRVTEAQVAQSSGYPQLDNAALTAVRAWEFVPLLVDGVPRRATGLVPVRFALQ